ncbi:MAG: TetR/AcrR family transcriptional regulator [Chloroflexaceae bacterium]|nr:TetR/AcrR family transcriptional regulator [Chloroflexaceae bacterium]
MTKRPADTKTFILDTAQELIQRFGINGMSYQDISEVVGIRKASIHTHFRTKDDLVAALLDRYTDEFLGLVDGIISSEAAAAVKLRQYCDLFAANLRDGNQDKACLCGMLGAELETLNSQVVERVQDFLTENEARLLTILEEGRQNGSFLFPGSSDAMAKLIFSLLEGASLMTRAKGGLPQFQAIAEQLLTLLKQKAAEPSANPAAQISQKTNLSQ